MLKLRMTIFSIAVLSTFLLLATIRPAHAYLDPGTGSYLFQTGLALVLGGVFIVRHQFEKFCMVIRRRLGHRH